MTRLRHPKRQVRDLWRIFRVGYYLLKRPHEIPAYLKYGPLCQKSPLELGKPWWSFGAVQEISGHIDKKSKIFEFGSGGSSVFLAEKAGHVVSVEDNEKWAEDVRKTAAKRNIHNLKILCHPYDFGECKEFENSSYFNCLTQKEYDLIIVDGQEGAIHVRDRCFWHAEKSIKKNGVILVDDSYRYPQIKKNNRARHIKVFKGLGFCRAGVTETTLFFYD